MVLNCCSFSNLTFPPRHVSISVEPPCLDGHFFEWPRSDVELYVEPVNDGSSSRPGQFLDNFAEVMLNFNNRHSLKLRHRLRSTHYNNRMRCLIIINSWPAFATIDSTTIASTTDTFIHYRCLFTLNHLHQRLNQQCRHQLHFHSTLMRCFRRCA